MSYIDLKFLAALTIAIFLAGCKKDDPGLNEVFMKDSKFNPSSIIISPGTTITWTNKERGIYAPVHTVTSGSNGFDSGDLEKKETFSHTFSAAGTFPYYCKHHSGMTGTVTVQ